MRVAFCRPAPTASAQAQPPRHRLTVSSRAMRFRKTLALPKEQGLGHIGAGSSIAVTIGGAHAVAVEIQEAPATSKDLLALLVATSEFEPSTKVTGQLASVRNETAP